jgi:hypothetical protein
MRFDAAVAGVFDDLHRQVERGEVAEEGCHAHDFAGGVGKRLALFAGQEARQFIGVGFDDIRHLADQPAAFLDRGRGPGRKGRLGRGNGGIELVLGGARALRQHFLGRGIEDRHGLVAGNHLAVNEKVEFAHLVFSPCGTDLLGGLAIFLRISRFRPADYSLSRPRWPPKPGLDAGAKVDIYI